MPLRPLLAELERLERARRIELEPLRPRRARRGAGRHPRRRARRGAASSGCYARSEGNPLYTEELLAAGLDGRGAAPQSLRDAFHGPDRAPVARRPARRAGGRGRPGARRGGARRGHRARARRAPGARCARRWPSRCWSPTPTARSASATRCCARRCTTTCCPASAASCTWPWPGTSRASCGGRRRARARADGCDRRPLRLRRRPARGAAQHGARRLAAERANAYGEAADLAERALELWPRVAPRRSALGHRPRRPPRPRRPGALAHRRPARAEVLLQPALGELDPDRDPARYAALLGSPARNAWSLNRGAEAVDDRRAGARHAARRRPARPAPAAAGLAGPHRSSCAGASARRPPTARSRSRRRSPAEDRSAESEVLNTLGMAQVALGDVEEGIAAAAARRSSSRGPRTSSTA